MSGIDLHVHTSVSDGTYSPREVVRLASESGLKAVAITDHDSADGCREAMEAGPDHGIEVIPGIEFSTKYKASVHVLSYCIDPDSALLRSIADWIVRDRDEANEKVIKLMEADGIFLSYDDMKERFGAQIGRPHFGQILVERGIAESVGDAFARFFNKGMKYFMPRTIFPIEDAVRAAAESGVAVLAHPFEYRLDDSGLRELIEYCMDYGLRGMECRYSGYTQEQEDYLEALADEYGLIKTGGSDYHGFSKPDIRLGTGKGRLDVPCEWLEKLKEAAEK